MALDEFAGEVEDENAAGNRDRGRAAGVEQEPRRQSDRASHGAGHADAVDESEAALEEERRFVERRPILDFESTEDAPFHGELDGDGDGEKRRGRQEQGILETGGEQG